MTVVPVRIGPMPRAVVPLTVMLMALASCAPGVVPEPGGRRPAATPAPAPAPVTKPTSSDWQDWPLTPGKWTYAREGGLTVARLGSGGIVRAWVSCDLSTRSVVVGRSVANGAAPVSGMMTVRTTFGTVEWPARGVGGAKPGMEALRSASDPGLDQIAFSRGRFALMLRDQPPVIAPTWAEPVRVIEDCRG